MKRRPVKKVWGPLRKLTGSPRSGKRVQAVVDPVTGMNRTETRYANVLEEMRLLGQIREWRFEAMKFRLADGTFYSPDFAVQLLDNTLEFIDVKGRAGSGPGGWEDDAKVKIKVAASLYPWFKFVGVSKAATGWARIEF